MRKELTITKVYEVLGIFFFSLLFLFFGSYLSQYFIHKNNYLYSLGIGLLMISLLGIYFLFIEFSIYFLSKFNKMFRENFNKYSIYYLAFLSIIGVIGLVIGASLMFGYKYVLGTIFAGLIIPVSLWSKNLVKKAWYKFKNKKEENIN